MFPSPRASGERVRVRGMFFVNRILRAGGALLFALACAAAAAQTSPQHPVRMIVGLPAGGTTDVMARLVSARLTDRLGQQVIVDNRPGANGIIAIQLVTNAQP